MMDFLKKDKKLMLIVIGIVILLFLVVFYFVTGKNVESDSSRFKREYESLNGTVREKDGKKIRSLEISSKNPMIYSDEDDILDMMKSKKSFVVYFGFTDCPWCRSILPNLLKAAKNLGVEEIYYVNIKEIRDTIEYVDGNVKTTKKGSKGYYDLLDVLDDVLSEYTITNTETDEEIKTGEKRIFAPNIVAVVDGKAVKMTEGISEKQTDGYMEITKEMNKESYEMIKCVLECVLENKKCDKQKMC